MATITNGTVTYERCVKTGDFEHKQASVVIHYALDDDDENPDYLIGRAGELATQHVYGMLRARPSNGNAAPASSGEPTPTKRSNGVGGSATPVCADLGYTLASVDVGGSQEPGPSERIVAPGVSSAVPAPVVQTVAAEVSLVEPASVEIEPPPTPVTNLKAAKRAAAKKVGPVEIVSQAGVEAEVIELNPPTSASASGSAQEPVVDVVEDFSAVAPVPTDVELSNALSRVNAKLKDAPRIRLLIGEFVASGESYTKIPDVRRAEFLARLNAMV